jgi:protein-S-isoprenylcysteine O-methyltransferase Ste14
MRNPIRLKNARLRFLPSFVLGLAVLWLSRPTLASFAVGAILIILGAALRSWGAGYLVKNESLTVTGPYAHMRHPLYAGTLLVGAGFCVIAGGLFTVPLFALLLPWFFLAYFPRKERIESTRLEERYGEAYAAYRDQVPPLRPLLRAWDPAPETAGLAETERTWSGKRYSDNNELGTLLALLFGLVLFGLRVQIAP